MKPYYKASVLENGISITFYMCPRINFYPSTLLLFFLVPYHIVKYELFNPIQLGLKATAATWPPQWREMVQGFVSAFPSMAWLAVSKAQESTCFLAVRG